MGKIDRRKFVKNTLLATAGINLGINHLSYASPRVKGANDKIVLGLIGAGARGTLLTTGMTKAEGIETKYVCEVDETRGHGAVKQLTEIQGYAPKRVADMRRVLEDKDVDAVVIATPGHWHALATVWACQAKKDVYVEKCISMSVWEGRKMIEAAQKYGCIVQCGMQNRSMPESLTARDYVLSGKMGKIVHVKVNNTHRGGPWKVHPETDPPETLQWDLWLGPTAAVPYSLSRHKGYEHFYAYGGGKLARTGCHTIDLARMFIGDPPHPQSVYAFGGRKAFDDERQTPDTALVTYNYNDFVMTLEHAEYMPYMTRTIEIEDVCYGDKFPNWSQCPTRIDIFGTKQMMYLGPHGGGWQVFERDGNVVAQDYGIWNQENHYLNFIDCVRSRKQPNCDIIQGHLSATLAHLANVSVRSGNKHLEFDDETESFSNDKTANQFLKPKYREDFFIPESV
jgi:predicted dehydrogenase